MATDLVFHARSDVGRVRDHNEDSYLCDSEMGLYVVADGMGGHAAGEVASSLAVTALRDALREQWSAVERFKQQRAHPDEIRAVLSAAVVAANTAVFSEAERSADKRGMGTTMTAMLLIGPHAFIAQVGDSRAYVVREGAVQLLTEDHSLVNELKRRGKLTPELLAKYSAKNTITRAVGILPTVEPDTLYLQAAPGDRFVLCSDGLHRYFTGDNELAPLSEGITEEESSGRMIDYANARGGADNVTAVVVTLPDEGGRRSEVLRELTRVYDALSSLSFFRDMEPRELLQVQSLARLRKVGVGEEVLREGDEGECMYVLLTGECSVHKGELKIAKILPGEHFGEMALVENAARSASVRADSDATLIEIHRTDLFKLLRESSSTGVKLLWNVVQVLAGRLRETSAQLGHIRVTTSFLSFEDQTAVMAALPHLDPLSAHTMAQIDTLEAHDAHGAHDDHDAHEDSQERERDTIPSPDAPGITMPEIPAAASTPRFE